MNKDFETIEEKEDSSWIPTLEDLSPDPTNPWIGVSHMGRQWGPSSGSCEEKRRQVTPSPSKQMCCEYCTLKQYSGFCM